MPSFVASLNCSGETGAMKRKALHGLFDDIVEAAKCRGRKHELEMSNVQDPVDIPLY